MLVYHEIMAGLQIIATSCPVNALRLEATRDDLSVSCLHQQPAFSSYRVLPYGAIKFHGEPWSLSNCDKTCELQLLLQVDVSLCDIRREFKQLIIGSPKSNP